MFLLIFSYFSHTLVYGKEFTYEHVIACGPEQINFTSSLSKIELYKYFYVHTASNGDFIIWNDSYQYPSFTENNYHQIYIQNGKTTSATLDKLHPIYKYQLISKTNRVRREVLMIDTNSMTFISRFEQSEPRMGVCWIVK